MELSRIEGIPSSLALASTPATAGSLKLSTLAPGSPLTPTEQLDYIDFISIYAERICAFHVKDAEFNPTGRQGVYSGYQPWKDRAGRFRSLGDGQVDFSAVFSAFATIGYEGWAVVEWECALKEAEAGAREGAAFVRDHIIPVTDKAFDDFAGGQSDRAAVRRLLGLD